jgi:hypothetical protein
MTGVFFLSILQRLAETCCLRLTLGLEDAESNFFAYTTSHTATMTI